MTIRQIALDLLDLKLKMYFITTQKNGKKCRRQFM